MTAPNLKITVSLADRILEGDPAALTTLQRRRDDALAEHTAKADKAAQRAAGAPKRSRSHPRKRNTWKPDPPELVEGKRLVRERSGGWCEAGVEAVCDGRAVHVHHVAGRVGKRAHDPENLLDLCSDCHQWAHANPERAMELGLLRSRLAVRPVGSEGEQK